MPIFRKKRYSGKSSGKVSRFFRGAGKAVSFGVKAYKLASKIAKLVNAETKYINSTLTGGIVDTGYVKELNIVGQGDTAITRNGNSIKCTELDIRGYWTVAASDAVVRTMVVLDKQCRGAAPGYSDIMESSSVNAFQNMSNERRFVILDDITQSVETNKEMVPFQFHHKFSDLHLYYTDGDADAAALKDNALFLVCVSTLAASGPNITMGARLGFLDN